MTPEDLVQARMQLWHQNGNALLTTADVHGWLDQVGFCSLLPSKHPLAALSQATGGNNSATPEAEALRAAHQLAAQLLAERAAVPLLWEETSMLTGEQYDAVASSDVLAFIYCLRGDRDLKKAPAGSPLVLAVWQQLQEGARTVAEIVNGVGRETTEAAVLRALRDLWTRLRVIPVLETVPSADGARWDLMQRVFPDAVKHGATMSQPLAVSAMVSIYLNGAVAATADEVEDALGPLASRSRVREVLNALQATRQLTMLPVGRSSAYSLVGGSAEILSVVAEKRDHDELKKQRAEAKAAAGSGPREFGERKQWAKDRGIAARTRPRTNDKSAGDEPAGRERKEWTPRPAAGGAGFAARKPYVKRDGAGAGTGAGEKREWKPRAEGARPAGARPFVKRDGDAPRKPFVKREGGGDFKPRAFSDRPAAEKREWKPRPAGARPEGASYPARKPFVKRDGDAPRKPFVKREGSGDFKPRTFGDRPASSRPTGDRKEWKPRAGGASAGAGARKPFERKPFVKRDAGDFAARKPFAARQADSYPPRAPRPDRPAGERREWKDRPAAGAGERKPFVKRESVGDKRFDRKPGGIARKPFGAKPGGFAKKPGSFGAKKTFGGSAPVKRVYKRKDEE